MANASSVESQKHQSNELNFILDSYLPKILQEIEFFRSLSIDNENAIYEVLEGENVQDFIDKATNSREQAIKLYQIFQASIINLFVAAKFRSQEEELNEFFNLNIEEVDNPAMYDNIELASQILEKIKLLLMQQNLEDEKVKDVALLCERNLIAADIEKENLTRQKNENLDIFEKLELSLIQIGQGKYSELLDFQERNKGLIDFFNNKENIYFYNYLQGLMREIEFNKMQEYASLSDGEFAEILARMISIQDGVPVPQDVATAPVEHLSAEERRQIACAIEMSLKDASNATETPSGANKDAPGKGPNPSGFGSFFDRLQGK